MNRIRLLPEQVANQIAAGEVVERPASVVKELVENALDADATRITVEIRAGGRGLIRIADDGVGMSRDDALLCLERHATSKVRLAEDLTSIRTMGFRGEALPSIASVSRMALITRERGAETAGTQVVIHGGKIIEVTEAGHPHGTTVEVRNLFFNLPARRKFLRSEETEQAHIHHFLTLMALAHPAVGFTYIRDGRVVWQLPAVAVSPEPAGRLAALKERWRSLSGGAQNLMPVQFEAALFAREDDEEGGGEKTIPVMVSIWGLIGQPGVSRANREDQHLFVNKRPIENRGLNFALLEGYHTALMKGRYPVCCLFLEIDPALVDVNIHPAKREVKFREERAVQRFVTQAIRQALLTFHGGGSPASAGAPVSAPAAPVQAPPRPAPPPAAPVPQTLDFPQMDPLTTSVLGKWPRAVSLPPPVASPAPAPVDSPASPEPSMPPSPEAPAQEEAAAPCRSEVAPPVPEPAPVVPMEPPAGTVPILNVPLRLIGVIGRLYVLLESDRGLVLMDQHAAHERVLFEQMLQRLDQGQAAAQRLLLPDTIELPAREADFTRQLLPVLNRLGVHLHEFGERTFLLDALPPFVHSGAPRQFVLELVDELRAAGREVNSMRLGEHVIAKTVCRHAVKAHDPLTEPELAKLIEDLRLCAMPYTCPHGRPTLVEINYRELEKKFGRQV